MLGKFDLEKGTGREPSWIGIQDQGKEDWNTVHLIVKGKLCRHYVQWKSWLSEVHDEDPKIRMKSGFYFGVQVHVAPTMKWSFEALNVEANGK